MVGMKPLGAQLIPSCVPDARHTATRFSVFNTGFQSHLTNNSFQHLCFSHLKWKLLLCAIDIRTKSLISYRGSWLKDCLNYVLRLLNSVEIEAVKDDETCFLLLLRMYLHHFSLSFSLSKHSQIPLTPCSPSNS